MTFCGNRHDGLVYHCHIHTRLEGDQTKYYMTDNLIFDSMYSMVMHYQEHPLLSSNFSQLLTDPVPRQQSRAHEGRE